MKKPPPSAGWARLAFVFKKCSCGRTFTRQEWAQLPNVRFWPPDTVDEGLTLEQRDCPCGSSITLTIKNEAAPR